MKILNNIKKALAIMLSLSCISIVPLTASAETVSGLFSDDFSGYTTIGDVSANWYLKESPESVSLTDVGGDHGKVLMINCKNGCPVVSMPEDTVDSPVVFGDIDITYDICLEDTTKQIQGFIALVADGQQNYGAYRVVEVYSDSNVTMVRSAQDNSKYAVISKNTWYTVRIKLTTGLTSGSYTASVVDANGNEILSYSQADFTPIGSWKNINFTSWSDGSYYLDNVRVSYAAPDIVGSYTVDYRRTAEYKGYAGGTVTVTPSHDMANVSTFAFYWGDENGILEDYTKLGSVAADGTNPVEFTIRNDIMIPIEATRIVAAVANGGAINKTESAVVPTEARLTDENESFSFEVISDTHTSNLSTNPHNEHILAAFNDIKANDPDSAAVLINGDIVDANTDELWNTFNGLIEQTIGNSIPIYYSIGNHELRPGTESDYDSLVARYMQYTGVPNDKVYYYEKINGQYFIFLGNEKMVDGGDIAYLYQTQIDWLEEILDRAEAEGTRAYVLLHQPLQNTVSSSMAYTTAAIQRDVAQDAEIRSIVDAHPNTIMFSGHGHRELESAHPALIRNTEGANYFDSASVAYLIKDDGTRIVGSQGLYVQVYDDKIIVRGRDFIRGKWISNAQFVVEINDENKTDGNYYITGLSADASGVTAAITGKCGSDASVIAVVYNNNDEYIKTATFNLPAGEYDGYKINIECKTEDASYAALYVWDGLTTMKPLGKKKIEKAKDILYEQMSEIGLKKVISWDIIVSGAKTSF